MDQLPLILLLFCLGLFLIIKGGDFFVDAASWIASVSGIPPFIIGATIVSLATTLPELLVSSIAAAQGKVDVAIGNGVGSVTVNVGLIMGISLICLPGVMPRRRFAGKAILMVAAAAALVIFSLSCFLVWPGVVMLLCLFVLFLAENIHQARRLSHEEPMGGETVSRDRHTVTTNISKFVFGAAGIVWGADLLVDNGSALAGIIGIPEGIIAVTVVALGTSLPELVTTITAIVKKQATMSIGNILGANIIDLCLILPVCSLISGQMLPIPDQSMVLDFPACLLVCLIAAVPTLISQRTHRLQGVVLIGVYAVYVGLLFTGSY